jgi:hypothetical protein
MCTYAGTAIGTPGLFSPPPRRSQINKLFVFLYSKKYDPFRMSPLWEISENLHRAELSALDRDKLVAEWARLVGKEVSIQPELKPKGGRPRAGEAEAARQLGLSQPDVHRAIKVASLTPEAQETARKVGLDDNRTALLEAGPFFWGNLSTSAGCRAETRVNLPIGYQSFLLA